jgi:primase-polymerase (primpol)-like protein
MPSTPEPKKRPLHLIGDPPAAVPADTESFFGLDAIEDPLQLLSRSTELADAFRASASRAEHYQAVAAARLTDPRRFDRMPVADLALLTGWTEEYATKMAEFGRTLLERRAPWE